MPDIKARRMLYYGLIYSLLSYGLFGNRVQRHSVDEYLPYRNGCEVHRRVKTTGIM
jgi:hypothetical protein